MNIKVLARFHPVGLCWVTVWWAQPVSETVPGSQQTTPKLNKHSKQAVLLPFHWSTKWGTWRRPCLKWHNLKTVESKFRAAWASLQSLTDCASFSSTAHRERVSTGGLRRRQNSSNARNPLLSWEDPSLRFGVPACACTLSCSVVQVSVSPWTAARLLCPWDLPGKNTGVGCHFLSQGICSTQESSPVFLALSGGFFTTVPPGKVWHQH